MSSNSENGGSPETRLDDWLDQLEEARELGEPLVPEELCDDLDLLAELRERYEKLCRMEGVFGARDEDHSEARTFVPSPEQARSRVIGRYKLLQRIGEGGMGSVWMAEQQEPIRRKVALKVIRSGHAGRQVIARFEAERQALAMMDHQHIARVFDAGTTESGVPYFVMELVEGIPITEYCNRRRLNVPERLQLFMQVCQAIQHAHTKGIIHRDIKPSNVLVTQYDGKPVVKVIDFGIAKALQADLTDKTCFTEFGQVLGTLAYMSPEQAEMNALSIDTRTDVFSLGILLYELLTGSTPISRETIEQSAGFEILNLIRSLETPRASELLLSSGPRSTTIAQERQLDLRGLLSLLRGDLDAVLLKATANERDRRYTTPEAFARDIERFLVNEPIEARPPSVGYRFRKFVRRNRAASVALGLLILGTVGTSVGMVWALTEKNRADQLANAERTARETVETQAQELTDTIGRLTTTIEERDTAVANARQQLAANYFDSGIREFSDGRIEAGLTGLWRAWSTYPNDDPTRLGYRAVLVDRLTFGGRSPGVPLRHEEDVTDVDISLDGTRVVTAGRDGMARIWDGRTGTPLGELMSHGESIVDVAISPDGSRVVTIGDNTARIWNARTGAPLGPPMLYGGGAFGFFDDIIFSPLGDQILTVGWDARLWDARTGTPLGDPMQHDHRIFAAAFSPDGERIVTSSEDGTARIWNAKDGTPLTEPMPHHSAVFGVAFSPDGTRIATASDDGTARFWNATTGVLLDQIEHDEALRFIVYSPHGEQVVTTTVDGTAHLWDAHTMVVMGEVMRHDDIVVSVSFSPDSTRLVTASSHTARLWNVNTRTSIGEVMQHDGEIWDVAFFPDGQRIITASTDGTARFWNIPQTPLGEAKPHDDQVPIGLNSTGEMCATVKGGTVQLWDLRTGTRLREPIEVAPEASSEMDDGGCYLAFSPNGRQFVTACTSGDVRRRIARLWDVRTGAPLGEPMQHDVDFVPVFSPDGDRLIAVSEGSVRMCNSDTGTVLSEWMRQHEAGIAAVAFSRDGNQVATVDSYGIAWIWDAHRGIPLGERLQHGAIDYDVDIFSALATGNASGYDPDFLIRFSPDGERVLTANYETARLWDARTGAPLSPPIPHIGYEVAFSPDGHRFIIVNSTNTSLWSASTGESLGEEIIGGNAAFSPDSQRVVTVSGHTARLWDANSGLPIGRIMRHDDTVNSVAFSPDGTLIVTCSSRAAHLWDAHTGSALREPMWHEHLVRHVQFDTHGERILTESGYDDESRLQLWEVQRPRAPVEPDTFRNWCELMLGMALKDNDSIEPLSAAELDQRRQYLSEHASHAQQWLGNEE